jgi:superfamily II DNA or RNA helicase
MTPRDYQLACHDAVLKLWGLPGWSGINLWRRHAPLTSALGRAPWSSSDRTHKSLLAALGTAAGKTIIAAIIIRTLVNAGYRVLFCADTDELCYQPLEKIQAVTGIRPTLEKAARRAAASSRVVVASVQSLSDPERLEDFARRWGSPDFIIHDEAHTAPERAAAINARFPDARILGLTATPFRAKSSNLSRWYEIEAFRIDLPDLIDQGWITPLVVQSIDIDVEALLAASEEFRTSQSGFRIRKITPIFHHIARILRDGFPTRAVLVFHPLINSSKLFTEICRRAGLAAAHCDGNSRDRHDAITAFERGEIRVMSNSGVFSQGVDFIRADCLLNLALTRSPGKFRQRAGRITRVLPGALDKSATAAQRRAAIAASSKPDALILDMLGQTEKLRLAGAASILARDEVERRAIARRITQTPQRLDQIQTAVTQAREEQLIHELSRHGQSAICNLQSPFPTSGIMEFPRNRFEPDSTEAKLDTLFASMLA